MKNIWSEADDKYCCDEFVRKYIIEKDFTSGSILVHNLALKLRDLDEGSIRMKISNIVYIVNFLKIKHTCDITPLSNFSDQNLIVMIKSFMEKKILFDRGLVEKLVHEKKSH